MGKEILTFGDIENKKNKFYHHKALIFWGEKNFNYFISYLYNGNKIKPINIMLTKTSAFVKGYYGQTKWMYFLIEDDDLSEKYDWDKVSADIKK